MNILIPYSWLRDFVKTKASPSEIAEKLSLTSFNVEKLHEQGNDFIYEIEMTPNRGDALSVLGIAREVYASLRSFGIEAVLKQSQPVETRHVVSLQSNAGKRYGLDVNLDSQLCPHFAALILDNVKIRPSPKTTQERLEKSGIRALDNVIDATNYIMLELGQPMHAFDYDKLSVIGKRQSVNGKKMILRESRVGESLATLDGVKRELPSGSIIIEDGEKIIDLCGIMGGENSAIGENTRRVILFAQIYDPVRIRKTSMKLALRTEAAQRFEKGLDCEMVLPALLKAAQILKENAGARVASKLVNIRQKEFKPHTVALTMGKLRTYLGVEIEPKQVTEILESLGFEKAQSSPFDKLRATPSKVEASKLKAQSFIIPSWRDQDIQIEEDLIEEVARLYGYHRIPSLLPKGRPPKAIQDKKFATERRLRYLLKDLGFTEVYTYSMVDKAQIGDQPALKLKNPLTEEWEYMKIDPVPDLLKVVEENKARSGKIKIFEMANIYFPTDKEKLPEEKMILVGLIRHENEFKLVNKKKDGFCKVKGIVETIFEELNIKDYKFEPIEKIPFYPPYERDQAAVIFPTKEIKPHKILGRLGKLKSDICAFDLHIEALVKVLEPTKTYHPISQFPPIIEDLSLIVEQKIPVGEIIEAIKKLPITDYQLPIELLDIYEGEKLKKEGKKSLTFRINYQVTNRQLTSKDVKPIRKRIAKNLEKKFSAKIRTAEENK